MKKFLLDTNICIYFLKGQYNLYDKINSVGLENCYISEITLAELKFGVENSEQIEKNTMVLEKFKKQFTILPIFGALDVYAKQKAKLKAKGKILDDFDLLIGATAIANDLILITKNTTDFIRMDGLEMEDWTN